VKRVKLRLECESRERLERGKALLARALGDAIAHERDRFTPFWQRVERKEGPLHPDLRREGGEAAGRGLTEERYKDWPDEPLARLEGRTAREAVREEEGRRLVADLLREIENFEARRRREGMDGCDPTWLWQELGIERTQGL